MVQTTRAPSLSQQAYDALRRDLIGGELEPGTKLMIADLQSRYTLGAMPLREALNRLSAEGMVDKSDQRGFFVPALNHGDYLDIQNARIAVEAAALRLPTCGRHARRGGLPSREGGKARLQLQRPGLVRLRGLNATARSARA